MEALPERREASPLGLAEIQRLAVALSGRRLDEIMGIRTRADGSMTVVVWPGPKLIFSAEQVEATRAATLAPVASAAAAIGAAAAAQPQTPARPGPAAPEANPDRSEAESKDSLPFLATHAPRPRKSKASKPPEAGG